MGAKDMKSQAGSTGKTREARLKAALKANIARRKAQAKARTAVERADESRKG